MHTALAYRSADLLQIYIARAKGILGVQLATAYPEDAETGSIERTYEAIRYMLFLGDGGKRLRPAVAMIACDACGGTNSRAMPYAQAVEEIHTYTLIVDDIQDEGKLRRNSAACHLQFGINTALLAASRLYERGLVPFHRLHGPDLAMARKFLDLLHRGQAADLEDWTTRQGTVEAAHFIAAGKTSALFQLALLGGAIAARASPLQKKILLDYGYHLGLAFQARDDVLSVISNEVSLGKAAGAEADRGRLTYPTVVGSADNAQAAAVEHARNAGAALTESEFSDTMLLRELATYAVGRAR